MHSTSMEGSSQQVFNVDEEEPDNPVAAITGPDAPARKQRALMATATALLLMATVFFGLADKTQAPTPVAHAFVISSPGINTRLRSRADTALPQKESRHRTRPFSLTEMNLASKPEQAVDRRTVLAGALAASSIGSLPAVAASDTASEEDTGSAASLDELRKAKTGFRGAASGVFVGLLARELIKGGDGVGALQTILTKKTPEIFAPSSERSIRLAEDLSGLDAKIYGAYWCSPCFEQKQLLGKEAMEKINCIECDRDGLNSQHSLCQEREVPGFPTWEIGGRLYPGSKSIEELEDIVKVAGSGFAPTM